MAGYPPPLPVPTHTQRGSSTIINITSMRMLATVRSMQDSQQPHTRQAKCMLLAAICQKRHRRRMTVQR